MYKTNNSEGHGSGSLSESVIAGIFGGGGAREGVAVCQCQCVYTMYPFRLLLCCAHAVLWGYKQARKLPNKEIGKYLTRRLYLHHDN